MNESSCEKKKNICNLLKYWNKLDVLIIMFKPSLMYLNNISLLVLLNESYLFPWFHLWMTDKYASL